MNVVQLDTNLVNGATYTFTFDLGNYIFAPSVSSIMDDISQQAPDFLTSVQVTTRSGIGLFTNYYDVQFTYEGDGSDVCSDVANVLVAAFLAGSNDNFTFVQAVDDTSASLPNGAVAAMQSAGAVLTQAGTSIGSAAGAITSGTLNGATSGLGAWLIPVILVLGIVLLFQLGGIGSLKKSLAG